MRGAVSGMVSAPRVWASAALVGGTAAFFGGGALGYSIAARVAVAASAGLVFVIAVMVGLMRRRKAKKLEEAVVEPGLDDHEAVAGDGAASMDVMKAHFQRSLQAVKDSPHGRNALVTMPWYLLIGPPGAGKTSLMQHSSLTFPQIGLELQAVPGVGGTRNCDWWFTEDAIYLDTAGRYTSQRQSRKEWLGFLSQMARLRRRRPLSGIILTVGLDQLLNLPEDKVAGYAQEIRRRYDEVAEAIDFVFPVYLVFNKADLVEGFCEYFDHLDRMQRAEPFGFRLPFKRREAKDVIEDFQQRYRRLGLDLLNKRSTALNGEGMSVTAKRQALSFPGQFQLIESRLILFLEALLGQQPFKETGVLRGVYFTSVVQLGTAVDRIGQELERQLGIEFERGEIEVGEQKVYFLPRLFSSVILPDRFVGFLRQSVVRRNAVSFAAAAILSIALGIWYGSNVIGSAAANREQIEVVAESAEALAGIDVDAEGDVIAAFQRLNTVLDQLRELARQRTDGVPDTLAWGGLYQGERLYGVLRGYYFDQIRQRVLTRVRDLLVADLDRELQGPDRSYAHYRMLFDRYHVYRMLTDGSCTPDETVMRQVLINDGYWMRAVFGDQTVADREAELVLRHGAYVAGEALFHDEWLVEPVGTEVATKLTTFDWVANAYQDMEQVGLANVPALTSEILLDKRLATYFVVPDVPGMYTQRGFETWVNAELGERSKDLAGILALIGIDRREADLRDELLDTYRANFSLAWQRVHGGIVINPEPFLPLHNAVRTLGDFASSNSPYRDLYQRLITEGQLKVSAIDKARSVVSDVVPELDRQREWMDPSLKTLLDLRDGVQTWYEGTAVGMRLEQLEELETLLTVFTQVRKGMGDALRALDDETQRAAKEAELAQILSHVRLALQGTLGREANGLWRDEVRVPFEHMQALYPFNEAGEELVDINEMAAFWHPQTGTVATVLATIDGVANKFLLDGPLLEREPGYRLARRILKGMGETWFADGAEDPVLSLSFHLLQRPWNEDVELIIGDQRFGLYDLPSRRKTLTWTVGEPEPVAVRTRIDPTTWVERRVSDDAWGLMRLLDQAEARPGKRRSARLTWTMGPEQQISGVSVDIPELQDVNRDLIHRGKTRKERDRNDKEIPGVTPPKDDAGGGFGGLFGGLADALGEAAGGAAAGAVPDLPTATAPEAPAMANEAVEGATGAVNDAATGAVSDATAAVGDAAGEQVDKAKEALAADDDNEAEEPTDDQPADADWSTSVEIEVSAASGVGLPMLRRIVLPKVLCP